MRVFRYFSIWLSISILLSGCEGPAGPSLPTPLPAEYLPTAIALTVEAGRTPGAPEAENGLSAAEEGIPSLTPPPEQAADFPAAGLATPSATISPQASPSGGEGGASGRSLEATVIPSPRPTRPRTPTPTPTATPYPEITLRLYSPGDASRVTSPLAFSAYLPLLNGGVVVIELRGEDGRVLVRQVKKYKMGLGAWANINEELAFEISAVAEVGRLVLRLEDEFGRPVAVNSVDVILLSVGDDDILPVKDLREKIIIEQPERLAKVQGGVLMVSGRAREMGDEPLLAELIAEDGRILGQRLIPVTAPGEDGFGTFAGEVGYSVEETTPARLVVYQRGGPVSEIAHLSGTGVVLSP